MRGTWISTGPRASPSCSTRQASLGIRATVESLTAQKIVVDHAMESAGALGFQMKQAEALIAALRRERDLACDLKAAVSALSDEGEEPVK